MPTVEIQSLANPIAKLSIYSHPGHDMAVYTEVYYRETDKFEMGQATRIYNFFGSQNFADLHDQFYKAIATKTRLNHDLVQIDVTGLDLDRFEKANLIEDVDTKSILTIYRDNMGCLGIQTRHSEYYDDARFIGPIIWVCAEKEADTSPAMRARRRIFVPIFDLTKELGAKFNRPHPKFV